MKSAARNKVTQHVSRSFPELNGVSPSVRKQPKGEVAQFLLIYRGKANLPNGRQMKRVVRVVADERGNILRMSTSR